MDSHFQFPCVNLLLLFILMSFITYKSKAENPFENAEKCVQLHVSKSDPTSCGSVDTQLDQYNNRNSMSGACW